MQITVPSCCYLHKSKGSNRKKTVRKVIHKWSTMADEALQDSFATTGWQLFDDTADADINVYTDSVVGYISKCIDDVVPKISICT